MARALLWIAHVDARPLGSTPHVEIRWPPSAWEWAAQSMREWGEWATLSVCEWAKTAILDTTQKRQRRSSCTLQIQIYFTAWVACAREMMAPTFLVAIDQCRE